MYQANFSTGHFNDECFELHWMDHLYGLNNKSGIDIVNQQKGGKLIIFWLVLQSVE